MFALVLLPAAAQTGRSVVLTSAARLGGTLGIGVLAPASAAGNYYEAWFSAPTSGAVPLPVPNVHGTLQLSPVVLAKLYHGVLAAGITVQHLPVPGAAALLGAAIEVQTVDYAPSTGTAWFADNDVTVWFVAGVGTVDVAHGTGGSATTGDFEVQSVDDATAGAPVARGLPRVAFQPIRHRGQEGYVEGHAGSFNATPHNSDIESLTAHRPARRLANAAYQVIPLPNGWEVAIVRHAANPRQFSLLSYHRATGTIRLVPGTTVTDTGGAPTPPSVLQPYVAFTDDGHLGAVIVHDSNPAVPDRVLVFHTDGSVPAVDVSAQPAVAAISTAACSSPPTSWWSPARAAGSGRRRTRRGRCSRSPCPTRRPTTCRRLGPSP